MEWNMLHKQIIWHLSCVFVKPLKIYLLRVRSMYSLSQMPNSMFSWRLINNWSNYEIPLQAFDPWAVPQIPLSHWLYQEYSFD